MSNEHEAKARAVKAYKIVRVIERLLDERPDLEGVDLASASEEQRARVATVAGVNPPSAKTWDLVCALLDIRAAAR